MQYYASAKHKGGGHNLDTANGFEVYKSDSLAHRLTVESCLLAIGHKIDGNKASTSTRDLDTLAPMILEEAPIKWNLLSRIRPPCLRTEKIPRRYRKFFTEEIQPPPEALLDPAIVDDPADTILQMNHNYNLRPRSAQRNSTIP